MKKILIVTLLFLFHHFMVCAQAPGIEWQKTFGGSIQERGTYGMQTPDGGYVISGTARSNDGDVTGHIGNEDMWIIKLSTAGTIQWERCFGGTGTDYPAAIRPTDDGGYIMAGYTYSNNGDVVGKHSFNYADYWVVKLNDTGEIQWQKCLGGTKDDLAYSISLTSDGGYIIGGETFSSDGDVTAYHDSGDYWIVKLDDTGAIQWQKSFGGSDEDRLYSVSQTNDGGYIVGGYTWSVNGDVVGNHGDRDCWLLKLNDTGGVVWQKCYGGSGIDIIAGVQQTSDTGYIFTGYTTSSDGDITYNHGNGECWVVKLDITGAIEWQKSLGGTGVDDGSYIQQTIEGGYVIAGYTNSNDGQVSGFHGAIDEWIVKLDPAGLLEWQKCLGGSSNEFPYDIQQTADKGYLVTGWTNSIDNGIEQHGLDDVWVVKLSPWPEDVNQVNSSSNIFVTPNPSDGHFTVTLPGLSTNAEITITNMLGQVVLQKEISKSSTEISLANVPGVYFVCVCAGGSRYNARLVVR